MQEAKPASALNHPNIVTIHDIASDNGTDYIAMEYVAGKTLDQAIPRQGMRLEETLRIAIPIADALAKAHSTGITHRDLKPSNLMVDGDGRVRVLDLGRRNPHAESHGGRHHRRDCVRYVSTAEDGISLYVSRHFPSAYLERLTIRTDGFVSVHADSAGGTMTTRPFFIERNKMALNYATSAAGSIRWEILDMNGNPLSGFSSEETKLVCGDQIAEVIELQRAALPSAGWVRAPCDCGSTSRTRTSFRCSSSSSPARGADLRSSARS